MRNIASPALAGLIVEFFYTRSSVLCTLFLEMFSREVPKTVVCLAATAVRSRLDRSCDWEKYGYDSQRFRSYLMEKLFDQRAIRF